MLEFYFNAGQDGFGNERRLLAAPGWPHETRYKIRISGQRMLMNTTHLCVRAENLRSNTGDDMVRVGFAADRSAGADPMSRATTHDVVMAAVDKAGLTLDDKNRDKVAIEAAKEEAKAEKERLKEIEREKKRKDAENARKAKEEGKMRDRDEEEERRKHTRGPTFVKGGAGSARVSQKNLGAKRYSAHSASAAVKKQASGRSALSVLLWLSSTLSGG
jgi:hypothetical protein